MTEQELIKEIKQEFPDFKIVKKSDSLLMKAIDFCLKLITRGAMNSFMDDFTTTIGNTIYTPSSWEFQKEHSKAITLRHERVHLRQARKYTVFLYSLLYLLVLPCFYAFYRTKFEKEAYEETIKGYFEYYGDQFDEQSPRIKEFIVSVFTSPSYFWMWIDKENIENWYDNVVANLKRN